jgi:hypothetical protein
MYTCRDMVHFIANFYFSRDRAFFHIFISGFLEVLSKFKKFGSENNSHPFISLMRLILMNLAEISRKNYFYKYILSKMTEG